MKSKKYKAGKLSRSRGKFTTVAIILIPLILIGAGSAYYLMDKNDSAVVEETTNDEDDINYSPPTEKELKATEGHKKSLNNQTKDNPAPSSASSSKKAKPIITSHGIYDGAAEVGSRVPGVLEQNGTCTLKLTKSGKIVSKSRKATPNVSEMSCGYISIPTSKLSAGSWSATVSYQSNKYEGVSDPVTIKVQ